MIADRENEIRKRAREIWESEGRPEGRDIAHWEQAKAELESLEDRVMTSAAEDESTPLGVVVTDQPKKKEAMKKKAPTVAPVRSARR